MGVEYKIKYVKYLGRCFQLRNLVTTICIQLHIIQMKPITHIYWCFTFTLRYTPYMGHLYLQSLFSVILVLLTLFRLKRDSNLDR